MRELIELHECEREIEHARLVLQERARIAREFDHSLGHAINVMVLQASMGRHVFADRPPVS